ncbi:MAG TPA: VOC family protein [Actinomycetota bacterium]
MEARLAGTKSRLIDRIERVDLRVTDIETSLGFYRDIVGLEVLEQDEESATLRAPNGPVLLTLTSEGVMMPADKSATGLFHVAIRFPGKAELGDALARLVSAGFEIGAGDHGVSEALYIDDPDGNGIELYYDRPRSEWPAPEGDGLVGMTTGPVDLQALLDAGRASAAVGAAAAPGTDVGHVHLQAGEIDRTVRFYADELGLDLMQRFGGQAAFLSSNGYHHHIGANTWSSRGGAPATRDRAGLDRVVFAVTDAELLERTRVRLAEHARRPEGDEGHELVVRDPDGIELRFVLRSA